MNLKGKKGVDISSLNGNVSIEKIKDAGYDFVMIRCGYGSDLAVQDDSQFENNVRKCEAAGAELVEVSLPHTGYAMAVYYIIAPAEASANLARFDGVRYGHRSAASRDVMSLYLKSRAEGFGPEVKRRIIMGTYVLSSGYYDAYYGRAQKVRTLIKRDFDEAFAKVDVMLTPCAPTPAFKFAELQDPLTMYLNDLFTIPSSLAGVCAASVPAGFTRETKLPVGVQFIAGGYEETTLLKACKAFERIMA